MPASVYQPWWSPSRPWGFRFSRSDLVVVLVGTFMIWYAASQQADVAILTAFVLGHFFLFCNVFRVGQRAELVWAGSLLLNVTTGAVLASGSWGVILPLQCIVTVVIVGRTLLQPDYHGAWCQRINPLGYRPESRRHSPGLLQTLHGTIRGALRGSDSGRGGCSYEPERSCTAWDASDH